LETVAFPAISTGVYGFPAERAAGIAIRAVVDTLRSAPGIRVVTFCCFSQPSAELHRRELAEPLA
jgi:O-acetyl-ADP-ribose deacetylase (regulator of RNase III)